MVIIPDIKNNYVTSFCQSITQDQKPLYIHHEPLPNKPLKECFPIVSEQIATLGGKQISGWFLLEIPGIWLEAEFHAIWERPDGVWVDITPRTLPFSKVLFLPDSKRQYQGVQVESIFYPLTDNHAVVQFIELAKEFFKETNKGDLAFQKHYVSTPRIVAIQREMQLLSAQFPRIP
jgi:hypothetical protein